MRDIRFALRMLARTPVVSLVVIASLALGIGANTAMYSIMRQTLYRAMPVPDPEQLVAFYQPGPLQGRVSSRESDMPSFSLPMFRDLEREQRSFSGIAGSRSESASISFERQSKSGTLMLVSGSYFPVLGVKPAIGRVLGREDDVRVGGHPVAVLGHRYWATDLGGRVDVLNKQITVNGHMLTIVGVAAAGFGSETPGEFPAVYVPIMMKALMTPHWDGMSNRKDYWVSLLGRLKTGVSREQAAQQINVPYAALLEEDAKLLSGASASLVQRFKAKRILLRDAQYGRGGPRAEARTPLLLLLAITGFVLLIACANAANLLLALGAGRRKEIAIRLSVGASRWQLIRQLLVEACLLSLAGGLLGLLVSQWTIDGVTYGMPAEVLQSGLFRSEIRPDVLLYSLAASVLTGLLFGLVPALQTTRAGLTETLKDQGELLHLSGAAQWFRSSLVIGQVAVSLLLLATSGLLTVSLARLTRVELGIRPDNVMTFFVNPALCGYNPQRAAQFFDQLEGRIRALPGIQSVSHSSMAFLTGDNWSTSVAVQGFVPKTEDEDNASFATAGPGLFATLGIPLIRGREFRDSDGATAPKVAIVNETFVRRFIQGREPLGTRMALSRGTPKLDIEIVGVVRDSGYSSARNKPRPVYYTPQKQNPEIGWAAYYVRTAIDPEQFGPLLRREVAELDSTIPVDQIRTMRMQIAENIFVERIVSVFSVSFAGLATLLAAIGLYGVLAFTVARRTREIGIRMALGARAGNVRALVMRDVAVMTGAGIVLGLGGAMALARLVESLLFEVQARDPWVIGGATVTMAVVALAAGYLPARRATKVDPQTALRWL